MQSDRACRFDGIDYSHADLAIAQKAACAIVPFYGTGDHGEQEAAREGRLWNDHPAVQGALRALHEVRAEMPHLAANARLIAAAPELLEALDKCRAIIKFHVKDADVCCSFSPDSEPFSALDAYREAVSAIAKARGEPTDAE